MQMHGKTARREKPKQRRTNWCQCFDTQKISSERIVKHVCLANRSLFDTLSEDTQTDGYGIPEPMPLLEIREYLCEVPYCSILADIIAVTGRPKSPMLRLIEPSSSSTGGLQIPQHIITQMNRGRHTYSPLPPRSIGDYSPSGRVRAFSASTTAGH